MGQQLSTGIALCTAWATNDTKSWAAIAAEAIESDALDALGQVTHVAVQALKAIAANAGEHWDVPRVIQYLALDAETDDGDSPA